MKNINDISLENFNLFCNEYKHLQKSQMRQDLFVMFITEMKKNGIFVEFGACDGLELTNTLILEKEFGWNGILIEPCKFWHNDLFNNRKCKIDTRVIWEKSGETLLFNEVKEIATLSNIDSISPNDFAKGFRDDKDNKKYNVVSITLLDLLKEYNVSKTIDYMSIDTEGSEYEIIKNFDFNSYDIKIISIEHNETENKEKIYNILTKNNYTRVLENDVIHSHQEDWYIKL
jgi:hypothetical protein